MSFLRRLRSGGNLFVFLGGILLAIFLFLLIAIVFFEQAQLKAVAQQRAMSELEKQAAALGYFIAEQKDALREVANGHAIKTYLANQALGMSMEYGLRASLLHVVGQLQRLKERKEVNGNSVYRYLAFFDLEGGALADDTAVMPDGVSWDRSMPLAASNANLLFANGDECLSACLVVPVVFKGGMVGFVMAEMDFPRAFDNLVIGELDDQGNRLVLRDGNGTPLFQREPTPVDDRGEGVLSVTVPGADLVLESIFLLEDAEDYLVSPWLPGAISILTLPLFLGLGYLLHLNNQNLVLKMEHAAGQEKWAILRKQRDIQHIISEAAASLLATPAAEMDDAIEVALQRTGEQRSADRAYLFLVSGDGMRISNTHEWCAPGIAHQRDKVQDLPLEAIPWWWERISREGMVTVPDVAALPPEAGAEKVIFEDQQIQSLVAFPLQKDDRTFGFLGYDAVHSRRDWKSEENAFLQVMADVIANALDRWRIETELKASEEKMREAQAYAHLGHWSLCAETKTAAWSDEIYRIVGLSPEVTAGPETLAGLLHEEDRSCVIGSLERSLEQAVEHNLDYRIIRPDGDERWVNCRARPEMDAEGHVIKLEGFIQDITERKQAEIKHYESEALFFKAFQAAGTLMTITALDAGVIEKVNDAFVQTTGYSRAEAIGKSSVDLGFISLDDRERLKHRILKDGSLRNLELNFSTKERCTRYCLYNGAIIEIDGITKLLSILQDITPLKQSQLAWKESEERFALAMRGSNDGVYDWDMRTDEVYYSPRWKSMLGYDEGELNNRIDTWEHLVDSKDRERSSAMLQDYMEGKRDNFSLEFRMQHKDGYWVDVLSRAYLVRNEEGIPVRVVGTHLDITERKKQQRQIEEQRNRAQQYLKVAGVMLIALDRSGRVTLINPKGCELLGLSEKEILGRDWFDNFLPKGTAPKIRTIFDQLVSGRVEPVEYAENPILTGQGAERLIAWHNSVVRDAAGHVVGTLSSGADVTKRRQAEQALRGERAFLQHVIDGIDDPILVISPEYEVLRMNRAAKETTKNFGLDASCVTCHQATHRCNQPCSGEDRPCPIQSILNTSLPCKVLHTHGAQNGERRTLEIAASPLLNDHGQVIGIIEVSRDISEHLALLDELKERELRYSHLAQHDPLTGLPNRLLFADRLNQAIHTAHRNSLKLAVLYIDLDRFKQVNDSFGHGYGDEVLRVVASRLQELFREDDTVARMGGDEFTVILPNLQRDENAALVARKISSLFDEPFEIQGHGVFLGASIGISMYPQHGTSVDDLVRNSDTAMYRAKEQGRKTFRYYSEELTEKAFERVLLESRLHKALDRGEFVLYFQPQFDLQTANLCGLEALVRWQQPDMGLTLPGTFISLAEDSGIIIPMGAWILHEACRQMKAWQNARVVAHDALISVNLSAKQFDQSDLIEMVDKTLRKTGLDPRSLELEITESIMMRSPDLSGRILQQLRDFGVKVAIDDFGTGYSSMSHLKLLPLTKLKIDKSFISDIPRDANDMAITKAVIALADSLSLTVLAEGVETEEQRAFLLREGCHSGQGYLFSRPLRARDFEAYMQNNVYPRH